MHKQPTLEQVLAEGRVGAPYQVWPSRGPGNRLEPEAWPQLFPRFQIEPGATVFTIGSCFARNIEDRLAELGFRLPMWDLEVPPGGFDDNRNGVLNRFTPASMHQEVEWASRVFQAGGTPTAAQLAESLLDLPDGRCVDLQLGGLAVVTREQALALRRALGEAVAKAFTADVVVITLGQTETWWDAHTARYLQKIPNAEMAAAFPGRFAFRNLGFEECLRLMRETLERLRSVGKPGKRFLVTVSPVPMWRTFGAADVLVANTYSKSLLRTVAGCLFDESDDVDYFPSYESVMLSERERTWDDDQLHPTADFVDRVVRRLIGTYLRGAVAAGLAAAREAMQAGRPEAALAALDALDPARAVDDFERAHFHRLAIAALKALGRHAEIPAHLEAMAASGPLDVLACRELAAAWDALDRPDRALAAIEHLPIPDDDPAGLRRWRARLLARLKRAPEALADFRVLAARAPGSTDLQLAVARLALETGDLDLAETAYRAACELAPANPQALEGLVRLLLRRQGRAAALDCIDAAAGRGASDEACAAMRRLVAPATG